MVCPNIMKTMVLGTNHILFFVQILARCCPNLKKLALRGCELIGDDGLEAVAYYCRGLTQLNIQDTPVTLRGYRAVKKYCKRCVIEHTNPGFCWSFMRWGKRRKNLKRSRERVPNEGQNVRKNRESRGNGLLWKDDTSNEVEKYSFHSNKIVFISNGSFV